MGRSGGRTFQKDGAAGAEVLPPESYRDGAAPSVPGRGEQ